MQAEGFELLIRGRRLCGHELRQPLGWTPPVLADLATRVLAAGDVAGAHFRPFAGADGRGGHHHR